MTGDDKNIPIMMIRLDNTEEDCMSIYFKLLEEVKKLNLNIMRCRFTWMPEESLS